MAEVIHHDVADRDSGSGMGFMLGLIVLVVLGLILIFYGLPFLQRSGDTQGTNPGTDINITAP